MLRKLLLPTILLVLAYGFWVSPDFKEISAGVAIFLFGMLALEEGFKAFTGGTLETVLRKSTDRLWKSILLGITSTTIMQSSSLVSLITISFLSAGLITLVAGPVHAQARAHFGQGRAMILGGGYQRFEVMDEIAGDVGRDEARERLRNVWQLAPFDPLNFFFWIIAGICVALGLGIFYGDFISMEGGLS